MRTLAGELVSTVESFRQRNVAECFCVSQYATAHEGRCTLAELVLDKAKKLGVGDGGVKRDGAPPPPPERSRDREKGG